MNFKVYDRNFLASFGVCPNICITLGLLVSGIELGTSRIKPVYHPVDSDLI
jgi:hypothetical protein